MDSGPLSECSSCSDSSGASVKIWSGANAISKGDPDGKTGIIAGILIAAAAAIMSVLFYIFGLQDAVLTPRF